MGDNEATALMVVSGLRGDVSSFVRRLLVLGADPSMADDEGWTALHWAAFHSNPSAIRELCRAQPGSMSLRALLDVTDENGATALKLARTEAGKIEEELRELRRLMKEEHVRGDAAAKEQLEAKASQLARAKDVVRELEAAYVAVNAQTGASASRGDDVEETDGDMEEVD